MGANQRSSSPNLSKLIDYGYVTYDPIVYQDFLPVSAAGIFTSNLRGIGNKHIQESKGDPELLEKCLAKSIHDPFALHERMQADSVDGCRRELGLQNIALDQVEEADA